ncbi:alpha/beta fold hydrolase [Amycolatopsis aidingensis]|uniref:alpha/beta fold hydrolase n=1 Tax=Amycolatopsis aidingensis TaxID=2842453 RepID=UPI001C0C01BA|nr:alpha/beta fold hydrolase [Amycolatopsis aidingensis]
MTAIETRSSLVYKLGSGDNGRRLVALPPAGGGIQPYLGMARSLTRYGDVHALRASGLADGEQPDTDVPAMVSRYLETIRALPTPPDVLVGWSLGGVLAWEVAVLLKRQTGRSAAVVMLDSFITLPTGSDLDSFATAVMETLAPTASDGELARFRRTTKAHVNAAANHEVTARHDGPTLLLACANGPVARQRADWERLSTRLTTHVVECGHFELLGPTHQPTAAGYVNDFVRRVFATGGEQ